MEANLDVARSMFEVNVFGVAVVCQIFTPLIIAPRGTIVSVCSISGHVHNPWMGFYGASKAAVEVISETMRPEMAPLGVRVISLVMGAVTSNLMTNGAIPELSDASPYKPAEKEIVALARGEDGHPCMPTETFAKQVVNDMLGGAQGKLWRGQMVSIIYWLTKFTPLSILVSRFFVATLSTVDQSSTGCIDVQGVWVRSHEGETNRLVSVCPFEYHMAVFALRQAFLFFNTLVTWIA
jgi:1-acylglycerone phosphate reductase